MRFIRYENIIWLVHWHLGPFITYSLRDLLYYFDLNFVTGSQTLPKGSYSEGLSQPHEAITVVTKLIFVVRYSMFFSAEKTIYIAHSTYNQLMAPKHLVLLVAGSNSGLLCLGWWLHHSWMASGSERAIVEADLASVTCHTTPTSLRSYCDNWSQHKWGWAQRS